jgi:hypothetical protein
MGTQTRPPSPLCFHFTLKTNDINNRPKDGQVYEFWLDYYMPFACLCTPGELCKVADWMTGVQFQAGARGRDFSRSHVQTEHVAHPTGIAVDFVVNKESEADHQDGQLF